MNKIFCGGWITLFAASVTIGNASAASLEIQPEMTRSVKGISELERKRYFSISDAGNNFQTRLKDAKMYDYLVNDLGVNFGRLLGPVQAAVEWDKAVIEDKNRPGFADIEYLKKRYASKKSKPTKRMLKDFGQNLNVAAHGNHNTFPDFMGKHMTKESKAYSHPEHLPENIDAAAELSAAVMKYSYNDFTRPAYYEPVNEPHWSFHKKQHIADWHLKTKEEVQKLCPEVKVGGYCSSVSYFFQDEYRVWASFEEFMKNTGGKMDFYSFHTYDYYRLEDGDIIGRVQSGLPLEGTFDMVAASASNHFGTEKPVVVSEHGGSPWDKPAGDYRGEKTAQYFADKFFPKSEFKGDDFAWEMKKRSVIDFVHVSSMIANTMTFMDHPHVLEKAVPFILLNSFNWDPKYYAVLYTPYNYTDKSKWVPSQMVNFYKFFKGVKGRRVQFNCSDSDLQTQAFVDGNKLFVAINNLSSTPESLDLKGITGNKVTIRRFGRNKDYTPYFKEEKLKNLSKLQLSGREAVMIIAEDKQAIKEQSTVNILPFYGDKLRAKGKGGEKITINVNNVTAKQNIDSVVLRVALAQEKNKCKDVRILLNDQEVNVANEDSAERYWDFSERRGSDFATMKIASVSPALLKADNKVTVIFPDGQQGAVGSVVIRVGVKTNN